MNTLVLSLLAFYVGWLLRGVYIKYTALKLLRQIAENMPEESNVVNIVIEKHDNSFFVYKKEDSMFLAKADTREELENKLRQILPGKTFGATQENLREVGFL